MSEEREMSVVKIGFWMSDSGKAMFSHSHGLTVEQIELLHSLKVGDRLIAFPNKNKEKASFPDLNITLCISNRPHSDNTNTQTDTPKDTKKDS